MRHQGLGSGDVFAIHKRGGPPRLHPRGPWPVQLRLDTRYTSDEYVSGQGWRDARLAICPRHPGGGCGFRRRGTYACKSPSGTQVARWYCRQSHQTFSLLPDCLAARLPGTLVEVESVVLAVEQAPSLWSAVDRLRPDADFPSAIVWTRRRVRAVRRCLRALRGLMPQTFAAAPITLSAFAEALGVEPVLPALRATASDYLHHLPSPLGFRRRIVVGGEVISSVQQPIGPDPPDNCV
jgi:hypothetical protein